MRQAGVGMSCNTSIGPYLVIKIRPNLILKVIMRSCMQRAGRGAACHSS